MEVIVLHEELTERILGCLIRVHTAIGPGLPEHCYQLATALELKAEGLLFVREPILQVRFRDVIVGQHRPDFIIESKVVLELKSVLKLDPVFKAQVIRYLQLSGLQVGLLVNFNAPSLVIKRVAL